MTKREDLINEIVEDIRTIAKKVSENENTEGAIISSIPLEKLIRAGITLDEIDEIVNSHDDIKIKVIKQNDGIVVPVLMFEILEYKCCNKECKNCTCNKHTDKK